MVVKVYGPEYASSQRVIVLIEKEIELDVVDVDAFEGENKSPNYLNLSSFFLPYKMKTTLYFESRAIIRYHAEKYKSQGTELFGKTMEEKGKVEQWLDVEAHNFNPPLNTLVIHTVFSSKQGITPDQKVIQENEANWGKFVSAWSCQK